MDKKHTPSLEGLIQAKGAARPAEALPQRGATPARVLQANLQAALSEPLSREARAKSLTLRLSEPQYERLRRFAFERRLSHQDVIERGLMEYLDRQG